MKTLTWVADSRSKVRSFPAGVQDDIGYALYAAQLGEMSHTAKVLHGLGSGVMEIVANDESGTYRAVYAVSIVIHAFQKKSKAAIATPKLPSGQRRTLEPHASAWGLCGFQCEPQADAWG